MSQPRSWNLGMLGWYTYRIGDFGGRRTWGGIDKPTDGLGVTQWCVENLKGDWSFGRDADVTRRPFYVKDKMDAMLFKLTWIDDTVRPQFRP